MQPENSTKGFFTIAQQSDTGDYIRHAYALALSLKHSQTTYNKLSIGITPNTTVDSRYLSAFDKVIEIPWGDAAKDSTWKLENEWKSYWMSPYDETIKLDSDMLFFTDITSWWDSLSSNPYDIVFTNQVLNWRGEPVTSDIYRKVFTANKLPNIYTAFSYFRKSQFSADVYNLAKMIFWNWEKFFENYLEYEYRPTFPSTDVIFAIAMKIIDEDMYSYSKLEYPTFTHMKSQVQGWTFQNISEDWRQHVKPFFNNDCVCKIGNHRQLYPLHYHVKEFLTDDILSIYEKAL